MEDLQFNDIQEKLGDRSLHSGAKELNKIFLRIRGFLPNQELLSAHQTETKNSLNLHSSYAKAKYKFSEELSVNI